MLRRRGGVLVFACLVLSAGCSGASNISGSGPSHAPPAISAATGSSAPTVTPTPTPTPTPTTFQQTYADVNSGVLRVDTSTCDSGGSGTGFLVGPDLIATVAHVVSGAATVRITQGIRSTSATVLGFDETTDTALLRSSSPLQGHVFTFSPAGPQVGERIGVIGFPAGDSGLEPGDAGGKSFKEGSVNGVDRKIDIAGATRTNLVELDALGRGGNSGSPVVTLDGAVVGLFDAGPTNDDVARARFAVSSLTAQPLVQRWQKTNAGVAPETCTNVVGPDGNAVSFDQLPGGESNEIAATLNLYFRSINQGDYETAYAQEHPVSQSRSGLAAFKRGVNTSTTHGLVETWWYGSNLLASKTRRTVRKGCLARCGRWTTP